MRGHPELKDAGAVLEAAPARYPIFPQCEKAQGSWRQPGFSPCLALYGRLLAFAFLDQRHNHFNARIAESVEKQERPPQLWVVNDHIVSGVVIASVVQLEMCERLGQLAVVVEHMSHSQRARVWSGAYHPVLLAEPQAACREAFPLGGVLQPAFLIVFIAHGDHLGGPAQIASFQRQCNALVERRGHIYSLRRRQLLLPISPLIHGDRRNSLGSHSIRIDGVGADGRRHSVTGRLHESLAWAGRIGIHRESPWAASPGCG
jgi:hypothetical protein